MYSSYTKREELLKTTVNEQMKIRKTTKMMWAVVMDIFKTASVGIKIIDIRCQKRIGDQTRTSISGIAISSINQFILIESSCK